MKPSITSPTSPQPLEPKVTTKELVRRWILCEYAFRLGPYAYTTRIQDHLVAAEEALRAHVAGHKELGTAGETLLGNQPEVRADLERVMVIKPVEETPQPKKLKMGFFKD